MNQLQNFFVKIIADLNPFSADLTNPTAVSSYVLRVILLVAIVVGLVYLVRNYKKLVMFTTSTFAELKKIHWLTKRKTYEYSLLTVGMIFFFTLFILLADQTFLFLRNLLIFPSI